MTSNRGHRAGLVLLAVLTACPAVAATARPKAPPATIKVNAQPPPARVFLDSIDLGLTPLEIPQRDTMTHRLTIEAPWYRPWALPVKFDPRAERTIDANLRRKEAVLIVVTDPPGAMVSVNGNAVGRSPQTLDRQAAGRYELTAGLKGYQPSQTTMVLDEERTYSWTPALVPKVGQIIFSGWPRQAEIICRDRPIGSVPMVWDGLKQGAYNFEIKRAGFEPAIVRTYVTTDSPSMVTVRLRPTRAWTAISKSLFIPGSGQYYRGQQTKSLLFKGLWFVSVAALASKFNDRSGRYQRFHEAVQQYEKATHNHQGRYQEVENTYRRAHSANRTLNIVIAATAVIYVVNILDAAWSVPNRGQFNHREDTPREP